MPYTALPMMFFAHSRCGKCTGISFVNSTTIDVCNIHRIHQHMVFKDIAQRRKSSTVWFYGFKLHLAINDRGEILGFCLTPGNKDDRNPGAFWQNTFKETCCNRICKWFNGFLKNICQIGHSRHRSSCNFITNLVSDIAAYPFYKKNINTTMG